MPNVRHLDHLVLTVQNIETTMAFYTDVLGMEAVTFEVADGFVRTALAFGEQKINLHKAGAEFEPKSHQPTPGSADLCFLTDQPLEEWLAHCQANGIRVEDGPVARTGATGPLMSIYMHDPDQNLIEISNPR